MRFPYLEVTTGKEVSTRIYPGANSEARATEPATRCLQSLHSPRRFLRATDVRPPDYVALGIASHSQSPVV